MMLRFLCCSSVILILAAPLISCSTTSNDQRWSSGKGVEGDVGVGGTKNQISNVPVRALKGRLEEIPPLEIIGLPYMVLKNANVRGGPSTDFVIVDGIKKGETVRVIGKVIDANWLLIVNGELVNGFVYASLLSETSGTNNEITDAAQDAKKELSVSTGEVEEKTVVAEQNCRSIRQKIILEDGSTHEEEITACKGPDGWIVK